MVFFTGAWAQAIHHFSEQVQVNRLTVHEVVRATSGWEGRLSGKVWPEETSLLECAFAGKVADELIDEEDGQVFEAVRQKRASKKAGAASSSSGAGSEVKTAAAAASSGAGVSPAGMASSSSIPPPAISPSSPCGVQRRKPVTGRTPAEMKSYMPQGPGRYLSYDNILHNKWKVEMKQKPSPPRIFSKCFADGAVTSEREALLMCLRWAWAVEVELSGTDCPFDLSD